MTAQNVVIGVFADRAASMAAIQSLKQAGFGDKQVGFVARRERRKINSGELGRGIVGGILGGVDMLILPFTGPADAIGMLEGTLPAAENAIDRLLAFRARQNQETRPASADAAVSATQDEGDGEEGDDDRTGVAAGSIAGGVVGAAGAALLIPGIGPAVAGGILTVVLAGAAMGGIAGGFLGAFANLGVPKEKAHFYEREVKAGNVIVTVLITTPAQEQQSVEILQHAGAHDIEAHAQ